MDVQSNHVALNMTRITSIDQLKSISCSIDLVSMKKITGSIQFRASIGLQSTALVVVHLRKPNKHVYL